MTDNRCKRARVRKIAMSGSREDIRPVARRALLQLFEPLTAFAIDAGLSARDMNLLVREAAVKAVAQRQLEVSPRFNMSGIAATTGISRAEISRILRQKKAQAVRPSDSRQQSTNRILTAWQAEPKFTDLNGRPRILRIYGRGNTFEALVRSFGGGIPPRAVLDELLRSRVVDVLPGQRIQARTYKSANQGFTPRAIKAFGDRASDLFSTLLSNIRTPEFPRFLATISVPVGTKKMLPLVREHLSNRSAEFVFEMQQSLPVAPEKRGSPKAGVTVFYHEPVQAKKRPSPSRTNLHRRPSRRIK
jgi:hypothetical protein